MALRRQEATIPSRGREERVFGLGLVCLNWEFCLCIGERPMGMGELFVWGLFLFICFGP